MALVDPGAGLETKALRRTARVDQWQAQYEGLSEAQKLTQARKAVEDMFNQTCLYTYARVLMDDPTATVPEIQTYIESRITSLTHQQTIDKLSDRCDPPTDWEPEELEQGEINRKTLVIRSEAVANGIRRMFPILPRIGSVPPVAWGSMAQGTATINGVTGESFATGHPFHESHLHLLEAIVRAEDMLDRFVLVDELSEVDWIGTE